MIGQQCSYVLSRRCRVSRCGKSSRSRNGCAKLDAADYRGRGCRYSGQSANISGGERDIARLTVDAGDSRSTRTGFQGFQTRINVRDRPGQTMSRHDVSFPEKERRAEALPLSVRHEVAESDLLAFGVHP